MLQSTLRLVTVAPNKTHEVQDACTIKLVQSTQFSFQ